MEELSSVGEQVFAAECILSKRLRKVRASPPSPLAHPALCAAHRPLFSPRRASWNTWSSGAAGPLSESPVRGRLPACASRPGWERRGDPLLSGPGGKFCGSGPGGRRPTGDALCLRAHGERVGRPPAPAPSGPALLRAARFWRPFVACAPALERAVAGAGHGPLPLPKLPRCNLRFLLVVAPPLSPPPPRACFLLNEGKGPGLPRKGLLLHLPRNLPSWTPSPPDAPLKPQCSGRGVRHIVLSASPAPPPLPVFPSLPGSGPGSGDSLSSFALCWDLFSSQAQTVESPCGLLGLGA